MIRSYLRRGSKLRELGDQLHRADLFLANGQALDKIGAHFEAASRSIGNGDLPGFGYLNLGLDDVFLPVALRGGDVAGKRKVRQRRKSDVMRPADAGLEHASAPDAYAALLGDVVDADGLAEAADPANFDVDDLAGLHVDCGERVTAVADGFVEADGSFHAPLQHRVEVEVVCPQRLLDHHQVELVPGDDGIHILHAIGGVGVATEQDFRPAVADGGEEFYVPARLAFQLDTLIAGCKLFLYL